MTRGTCRGRTWLLPDLPWAESMLAAPSAGRTALCSPAAGLGPEAGSLPPELSLPLAGPPPSPGFGAALPALSLPALALSSSALGSLTHCFPLSLSLSLSLSPPAGSGASPSPGGALATRVPACSSPQALAPTPAHPGGPPAAVPTLTTERWRERA